VNLDEFKKLGRVHLRYICGAGHSDPVHVEVDPATGFVDIEAFRFCSDCGRHPLFIETWTTDGETQLGSMRVEISSP